jgi:hypothetical protein
MPRSWVRKACFTDHPGYALKLEEAYVHTYEPGRRRTDNKIKVTCNGCFPFKIATEQERDNAAYLAGNIAQKRSIQQIEDDRK